MRGIPKVRCPKLLLVGEKDVLPAPNVQTRIDYVKSLAPDVEAHVIPDAGHWVMYEQPAAYNAALIEMLG